MKAFVLLCLLHAAAGMTEFSWNGPPAVKGDSPPTIIPGVERDVSITDPVHACTVDKLSCECCKMVAETKRLKTYFDSTLTHLEMELEKANKSFATLKDSRVAFSVSLYPGDNFKCYGPFGVDTVITYQYSFINLGMAYNMNSGIFTVTLPGVYSLAVTSFSDAGSPGNVLAVCTSLQVNGQAVAASRELNWNDQEDSTTIAVALKLNAGDKVSVNLARGCFLCDDYSHYNTFSAFLLYADA
ncbi:PREDICTED: C1q-related factor-like [Cyprinodon variegatus]|uniref:Cerebellin 20 n=1 Tax=Cyprinodon variegatus TaxID=28743 RepID=A0A3Q2E8U2_CYPVA|nr:PREDICTED: C1q-related factor-like [Cyprinodon variegatus]